MPGIKVSENVSRETIFFNTVFNMVKNFSEGLPNVENLFSFPVGIMWKTFRRRYAAAAMPPPTNRRRRQTAAAIPPPIEDTYKFLRESPYINFSV